MDLKAAERRFLREFINIYRSIPALWRIRCPEYTNKNLRNDGYEVLLTKLKEVDPGATKESVIKKINNFRTSFRRELKKYNASKEMGLSPEYVYEPKLWYFEDLMFLCDQDSPKYSEVNLPEHLLQEGPDLIEPGSCSSSQKPENEKDSEGAEWDTFTDNLEEDPLLSIKMEPSSKRMKLSYDQSTKIETYLHSGLRALHEISSSLRDDHEFDVFGKSISLQLKQMPLADALEVQMEIQNVIGKRRVQIIRGQSNDSTSPL